MNRLSFVIILLVFLMISCKNNSTQAVEDVNITKNQVANVAVTVSYPSIPVSKVKEVFDSCDYVDYIFYELPISISQDSKDAILSNINFISKATVDNISNDCKPMGRKSFQANGEIILEADIYLDITNNCFYYVFLEDGKAKYANMISEAGKNFYFNVFKQAGIQ